jgi:hypothetical protein
LVAAHEGSAGTQVRPSHAPPFGQTSPQAPQLLGSSKKVRHWPPQQAPGVVVPPSVGSAQAVPTWPALQLVGRHSYLSVEHRKPLGQSLGWKQVALHWPALQALPAAQVRPQVPQLLGSLSAVSEQLPPQQKPVVPSLPRQAALSGAPAQPAQVVDATQLPPQHSPCAPANRQSVPSDAPAQADSKQIVVPVSQPKPVGQVQVAEVVWQIPCTQATLGGQALPA